MTAARPTLRIALMGNPNSGKTTLFNALTGMRQKVGNYPGVTVEKKEGRIFFDDGTLATLIDLPGTYSLTPHAPDEAITADVLLGRMRGETAPDVVMCVVDASNLERNLYLVTQLLDLGIPLVAALNMTDVAERMGRPVDAERLAAELNIPVIPIVAATGKGLSRLRHALRHAPRQGAPRYAWSRDGKLATEAHRLAEVVREQTASTQRAAAHAAQLLLTDATGAADTVIARATSESYARLEADGLDATAMVEQRYEWIREIGNRVTGTGVAPVTTWGDRVDVLLTHRLWGAVIFVAVMTAVFQAVFSWAEVPMGWIDAAVHAAGGLVSSTLPPGDLRDLLVDGALGGVGAVIVFVPQIAFLFFVLGVLEESGYMARAAFLMDRVMGAVGLHGKSFIPLLSSFACAIPGVMATRTIENRKDRLVTMLVAPLISCSARLPVYTLMIAACIPAQRLWGIVSLPALVLASMYLLGIVMALGMALLFRHTLLRTEPSVFLLELPPYRMPQWRNLVLRVWERSWAFVRRAGTFILGVSIVLWFLATYPKHPGGTAAQQLEQSFAGQAGKLIEPVIRPLGFDWKIGIGLIGSLLQREVFVSTMGTIYNVADSVSHGGTSLADALRNDIDPVTGRPVFSTLTAVCLMVYYALAMQCLSTVAVVRRESNSWVWPLFLIAYMSALAWVGTYVTYRVGLLW